MSKQKINIVWLKRDLRTQDHLPFQVAKNSSLLYIILFLYEPLLINYPDTSPRHLQFCYHSIKQMNETLTKSNQMVIECYGEVTEVFSYFTENYEVKNVFSYRESGIQTTWKRDKQVKKTLNANSIKWIENPER